MTDQNISLQELENFIQTAKSRPSTPISFEIDNQPSAPIHPPTYHQISKALLSQIDDNSSKNSVSFRNDDVKLLISGLKNCQSNIGNLVSNQETLYKCIQKVKQNVHSNGVSMNKNKESSGTQIICQSFVNTFFYLLILAFLVYHLFFQVRSYSFGK